MGGQGRQALWLARGWPPGLHRVCVALMGLRFVCVLGPPSTSRGGTAAECRCFHLRDSGLSEVNVGTATDITTHLIYLTSDSCSSFVERHRLIHVT